MTPASPWIGSTRKRDDVVVAARSAAASAAASPNGTRTKPGVNGPKPSRASGSSENETIVVVRPWKLPSQTMIVARPGRDALDLVAPLAGGLDRGLDRLGAGVHRQHAVLAAQRGEVARERPELVVGERAARERHAVELRRARRRRGAGGGGRSSARE